MTRDVIALTPKMPDVWALMTSLYAGGSDLDMSAAADGAVVQLHGPGGRPLVSVESPVLVQVPGEAERLLGQSVRAPFWWTEARASTAVPEAERLAGVVCGRLNALLGGSTWPSGAASTQAVDVSAVPSAGSGQPAVDVVTEHAAVVLVDRPVVALTSWLAEIMRTAVASRRSLQIVTPPGVRLTTAARTTLARVPNRWVVQDPECGYYDGLSGAVLRWRDGAFSPAFAEDGTAAVAAAFTRPAHVSEKGAAEKGAAGGPGDEPPGRQLIVALRTVHRPDERLLLGGALEAAWQELTGAAPAGWGTAEPVNLPWSRRQVTDLARERAPEPSQLIVVGTPERPAMATVRVTRTTKGVEEDVVLTVGYAAGEEPPLDRIEPLADTLVREHGLRTMLTSVRVARADLTTAPLLEGPPLPVAFTLGPDDVHAIGLDHARRPPVEVRAKHLGPASRPALHYPLGDGADAEAWGRLQQLTAHLKGGHSQPSMPAQQG
ncbi:DUF6177 family protein [Streptomyces bottropensis]|uniref:Uncharacterized protein n=1 Tax=Streptomyces bottropensis ATCC 25435 TaxID=1054862 RepID=M3E444_9ACTN|nr:DUF6177 family protein [Streptomyces bottropensis]EMF50371.1 hypothetical protein SBD_7935 [Streptomyces bottropensis ATCC 25435]MZD22818.1 hypothetical protein [Streptomyces sp. SID5476]